MTEGVFAVLCDPTAKKDEAFHDWFAEFEQQVKEIPGVLSGQRYMFGPTQVDTRPVNVYLAVFYLSDVASVRELVAAKFGIRTATEFLRLSDGVDQQTMMTTFFDAVTEKRSGTGPQDIPVEAQHMLMSVINAPLDIQPTFVESYASERLEGLLKMPTLISGQLFKKSEQQIQNTIYPFFALYPNADSEALLKEWPVPATNWKSLAAAREKDPALRPGGKLAGMQNRDFIYVPYVRPPPPPPPPPKPAPKPAAAPAPKPEEG
jgi:hypothetical protein